MFLENIVNVQDSIENSVQKQFNAISKNLNLISKNIKTLLPTVKNHGDAELLEYLNDSMDIIQNNKNLNTINVKFNNEYNVLLNKINNYGYKYSTEKFNESLKLRNELIKIINDDLSSGSIENGINIKNNIYKEINDDIEYFKKEEESTFISETDKFLKELNFN